MKKIYLLSGIVAILATPVLAAIKMPDINVTGEIRARGIETNNTSDFKDVGTTAAPYADDNSYAQTRVRVNLDSKLSDNVAARVGLQYGDMNWNTPQETIHEIQASTKIRHAYLTISNILSDIIPADLSMTLGRQAIGTKDRELVLFNDSIDAKICKLTKDLGVGDLAITGICAVVADVTGSPTGNNADTKIQGITGSLALPMGANVGGYYLRQTIQNPIDNLVDKNNVLGVKVDGSMEIASTVNYFFEYAKQSGSITQGVGAGTERDASALRIGGGYKTELASLGAVAVEGSYLSMSGDDVATDTTNKTYSGIARDLDYYTQLVDIVGGVLVKANGLKVINVNTSIAPDALKGVTLGFSYTNFTSAEKVNNEDGIGSEIDLTCSYKVNEKTTVDGCYARFSPGDAYPTTMQDSATMLKCQLVTKF